MLIIDSIGRLYGDQTHYQIISISAQTYVPHPRLHNPHHSPLRIILTHLRTSQSLPFDTDNLQPPFDEVLIDGRTHDLDAGECLAETDDPTEARDEESNEDDVLLAHAMVQEHPDGHERRRRRPDLCVEEEHPRIPRLCSLSHALGQGEVKEEWFAGLRFGLNK